MFKTFLSFLFFLAVRSLKPTADDLPVVQDLDIPRFMGRWYSIAHKPNLIEKFCKCSRTTDTLLDPKKIQLSESCLILGRNITSVSYAIPESETSGKWTNIQPLGPFKIKGDYWIIDLDRENYQWACIGQPSRKGFWILSRSMDFNDHLYNSLIEKAKSLGYDVSDIHREEMEGCQP